MGEEQKSQEWPDTQLPPLHAPSSSVASRAGLAVVPQSEDPSTVPDIQDGAGVSIPGSVPEAHQVGAARAGRVASAGSHRVGMHQSGI